MLVSLQNAYVEILTPNVMAFGGSAFGKWLGPEGGALMNGIPVLVKEAPERSLLPSAMWSYS